MKEVNLEIDDKKYGFFLNLVKYLDFVTVRKAPSKKKLLTSVVKGMKQAKLASEGKIKSRSAKAFLDEL